MKWTLRVRGVAWMVRPPSLRLLVLVTAMLENRNGDGDGEQKQKQKQKQKAEKVEEILGSQRYSKKEKKTVAAFRKKQHWTLNHEEKNRSCSSSIARVQLRLLEPYEIRAVLQSMLVPLNGSNSMEKETTPLDPFDPRPA